MASNILIFTQAQPQNIGLVQAAMDVPVLIVLEYTLYQGPVSHILIQENSVRMTTLFSVILEMLALHQITNGTFPMLHQLQEVVKAPLQYNGVKQAPIIQL